MKFRKKVWISFTEVAELVPPPCLFERGILDTSNVDAYKKEREAEANKNLFSPDYIKLEMAKALSSNTKFYFSGETSPLGGLLTKMLN